MSKKACYAIPIDEPPARAPTPDRLLEAAYRANCAGKWAEAAALCLEVLKPCPRAVVAHQILGVCQFMTGDLDGALCSFETAAEIEPSNPNAHNNLGNVLATLGRTAEAAERVTKAIKLSPNFAAAHSNLCRIWADMGRVAEALAEGATACRLDPNLAAAHSNLCRVLSDMGRVDEAIAEGETACRLDPTLAEPHANLCRTWGRMGRYEEAISEGEAACRLGPKLAEAHMNLGRLLLELGRVEAACASFAKAAEAAPSRADAHSGYLMCLQYGTDRPAGELLQAARAWAQRHAPTSFATPTVPRPADGKLRVGYVSGDMCAHPSGYVLEKLLPNHDKSRFEVYAY